MIIVFIILVIVAIAVDIFIATVWQSVATKKGHSDNMAFWLCLFLGPVGYIYVAALPDLIVQQNQARIISLLKTPNYTPICSTASTESVNVNSDDTEVAPKKHTHYWMCDRCGKKRSSTPCEHCGNN